MKKIPAFLFTAALVIASLVPLAKAAAVSYEPTYTCYYRDLSGHCMSYQGSRKYVTPVRPNYNYYAQPYYPAPAIYQTPWDYHTTNTYNFPRNYLQLEDDDDDNTYFDDDDDLYRTYYDADDFRYRTYKMQYGNEWDDGRYYWNSGRNGDRYEYEYTRIYCTGYTCDR